MNQRLVVLSGGIGAGKSAVGRLLAERGAFVVNADAIGHEILAPEEVAFAGVADRWPQVVVDGQIDRQRLGRIVFSDPAQLADLESITHPEIRRRIHTIVENSESEYVVVELPLVGDFLGEGWTRVIVDAPDATRVERLRDRGLADDEIGARMAAQGTRAQFDESGEYTVDNSGSLDDLADEVDNLAEWLRRRG